MVPSSLLDGAPIDVFSITARWYARAAMMVPSLPLDGSPTQRWWFHHHR
jgi:hypothetical protein